MKNSFIYFIGFILALNIWGCQSSKDEISNKITVLKGTPVSIPYDKMLYWTNEAMQDNNLNIQEGMRLVVYIDSMHCSDCELKKIHMWDDFVKLGEKYKYRFKVVFIIESSAKNSVRAIQYSYKYNKLEYPIFIDSTNVFSSMNPHIPKEEMYHVFLLDETGSIVLVGNPLFNPQIEDMLIKKVENGMRDK